MSRKNKAFVFGKFSPFHKGHEALISFALQHCSSLTVLVCCSGQEDTTGEIRKSWIDRVFENEINLQVKVLPYCGNELPNTSVSSREVSFLWAQKFKEVVPDCNLVVTSEPYGDYLAEYMNIQHLPFDPPRTAHPVSASKIRNQLQNYWHFLPEVVKPHYIRKVVLLGTESTGKSTLAHQLAKHFNATLIEETAREIIQNSNSFSEEDLRNVAREHSRRIMKGMEGSHSLMIIDTDIHITQSYASFTYGKFLHLPEEMYRIQKAGLYLYLNNDMPFCQDGTRFDEARAMELEKSHRSVLKQFNVSVNEISGSREERFTKAVKLTEGLLAKDLRENLHFR